MGPKVILLALILLVPSAGADVAPGDVDDATLAELEPCEPVEFSYDPAYASVEPECLPDVFAEDSK